MKSSLLWCDAHCHLSDARIFEQASILIERARRLGVERFVLGGTDPEEWQRQLELKRVFPDLVFCSFGLHPWWVSAHGDGDVSKALKLLGESLEKSDFLGETGLDFHPRWGADEGIRHRQVGAFVAQLDLAFTLKKPLILHGVRSHKEILRILRDRDFQSERAGFVHSFSGSLEDAKGYLDRGFFISLSGYYLKNHSASVKKVIQSLPLKQIMIETDCPDQSWDQKPNEPARVLEVAEALSQVLGVGPEELLDQSARNIDFLCKK